MAEGIGGVTTREAESLDTKSPRHEWERGWKVVAVSLLSYVFGSTGMFYAFGTFLKPLSSEFQWNRAAISGFWSISGVIFAVASPIVGRLADRFGVRRVILISVVLVALICGSQSLLTRHLWHYYALAVLWARPPRAQRRSPSGRSFRIGSTEAEAWRSQCYPAAQDWEGSSYLHSRSYLLPIMDGAKRFFCLACRSLRWGQFRWPSF